MPKNLRPKCLYDGIHNDKCPNNEDGRCRTVYLTLRAFMLLYHEFDGKNYIKCLCG